MQSDLAAELISDTMLADATVTGTQILSSLPPLLRVTPWLNFLVP